MRSKFLALYPLVLFIAAAGLLLGGSYFRVFDIYEYQTYDWRFRMRPAEPQSQDIVLIEIWDDALEKLGRWPFSRQYHSLLVDALRASGAKMVAFDILFVEPSADDPDLVAAAEGYPVYFSQAFDSPRWNPKTGRAESSGFRAGLVGDFRHAAKGVGHVNATADLDGKRRRVPPVVYWEGDPHLHLGVLMAADHLGIPRSHVRTDAQGRVLLGENVTLPTDENGRFLVNFAGKWTETFRHASYVDILVTYAEIKTGKKPASELEWLKDKVCFVGLTATGTHDINPVPLEPAYPQMGVHANVFNSILTRRFIVRLSRLENLLLLLLLLAAAGGLMRIPRIPLSLAAAVLLAAVYAAFAVALFAYARLWADLFYPLLAFGAVYLSEIAKRSMAEKKKRELLESELAIASEIQRSFLPGSLPETELLDISVYMKPAKHVGGDLYSVFKLGDRRIGVMLGDVSGKGVPAALFMAKSVSEFKFHSHLSQEPSVVLSRLNDSLSNDGSGGLFVTMTYLVFDLDQRSVVLSSGGHLPLLRMNGAGTPEWVSPEGGMPLSLMSGVEFSDFKTPFNDGDIFILYSDGISEAKNLKSEDYDVERLAKMVKELRGKTAAEIRDGVLQDIQKFVGRAPQHDDMTLIVVRIQVSK